MTLEEQLADTSAKVAHLTGKLDIVIPRIDALVPREECAARHDGLEKTLEARHSALEEALKEDRDAIREEIRKNGNGAPKVGLKLIALAAAAVGTLGVAVNFLGRIALHLVGVEAGP